MFALTVETNLITGALWITKNICTQMHFLLFFSVAGHKNCIVMFNTLTTIIYIINLNSSEIRIAIYFEGVENSKEDVPQWFKAWKLCTAWFLYNAYFSLLSDSDIPV